MPLTKILIANRGEIAIRVARACREMGLASVAVFSECDRASPHVRYADEAYPIGPSAPGESYLRIDRLLDAARRAGADAVHPGYGFLAENAAFAAAVADAGLVFIGPTARVISLMGSKTTARAAAIAAGVPVVPGTDEPLPPTLSDDETLRAAAAVGYPLLVKAVAGGGGKGMRTVMEPSDLLGAVRAARSEAGSAFGDASVYLERRLIRPRHIEVQLLGDSYGRVLPFVERECSIQRRHQKVVEESPSAVVSDAVRRRMTAAAAAVARSVGYANAGTIEFLLDEDGAFYFLEMNTRLQVEHPITEAVSGIDLVRWQIRIARGEALDLDPDRLITPHGHALECRIYAEDADNNFLPSPGRIYDLTAPAGPGIRDDSGAAAGWDVPVYYDPMISKLVAWAEDRPAAIARMRRALTEYRITGIKTTIPFFLWLLDQRDFLEAKFHTAYLDEVLRSRNGQPFSESVARLEEVDDVAAVAAALQTVLAPTSNVGQPANGPATGAPRRWRTQARAEGVGFSTGREQ